MAPTSKNLSGTPGSSANQMGLIAFSVAFVVGYMWGQFAGPQELGLYMPHGWPDLLPPAVVGAGLTWVVVFLLANTLRKRGRDPKATTVVQVAIAFTFGITSLVGVLMLDALLYADLRI